ncbi:MAG: DUF1800 family protein, partial [Chitinophagaceae bacterium]|nr:DUF1800 family protein [Polaromonas sp.]
MPTRRPNLHRLSGLVVDTQTYRMVPIALALMVLSLGPLASMSTWAQSDAHLAATWRATSRLGYGPTPATVQAAQANPQAWALQQLNTAYAASQLPPTLPAEVNRFNQPIDDLVKEAKTEREARKDLKQANASAALGSSPSFIASMESPMPYAFSRDMQQTASAWRMMACSDPALENPLLARMTEFWFNHLNVF